jgi:hypothetical protein
MKVFLASGVYQIYAKTADKVPKAGDRNFIGARYSIGARRVCPPFHFDHYDPAIGYHESPCNDENIPVIGENDAVIVTGLKPDTFVGLLRMAGKELPQIDLSIMEEIDLAGKLLHPRNLNPTVYYMAGIEVLALQIGFPSVDRDPVDVTSIIEKMMEKTAEEIIALGREAIMQSQNKKGFITQEKNVGFWSIGPNDPSSVARDYTNVDIVVVFLEKYKQIVISTNPKSDYDVSNRVIAGIQFKGSIHSSGSSRKEEYKLKDAEEVFNKIVKNPEEYIVIPQGGKRSSDSDD